MGDELVARVAQLVGVPIASELEGMPHRLAVDPCHGDGRLAADRGAVSVGAVGAVGFLRRGVELLDDSEQVREELASV
jgi:hypothetical protein